MRNKAKRSNHILSAVLFALASPPISDAAQPPPVLWERTFDGLGIAVNHGGFQQTSDGGYLLGGWDQLDPHQVGLVKTDARGILQWQRALGQQGGPSSMEPTSDGGSIIVGSSGGVYLLKLDAAGNAQWEKFMSFWDTMITYCLFGRQTADGGYIVTAERSTASTCVVSLLKMDSVGNVQWERAFSNGIFPHGRSVVQTTDGGYLVVGETAPPPLAPPAFLIKTDASGDLTWRKSYGTSYGADYAYCVQLTPDGGYVIAGQKDNNAWLFKVNSSGDMLWERTYGTGRIYSVRQTTDGGFILGGFSYFAPYRVRLIKTDANGNRDWEKTFAGMGEAGAKSVLATADGSYVVLGWTNTGGTDGGSAYLIKVGQPPAAARPAWRLYR